MLSLLNLYARTGFADEGEPNTRRTRSTPKVAIAMRVHNVQYITGRRALINPPAADASLSAYAACSNFSTALEMKRLPAL
jgi:hypothetical protein